MLTLYEEFLLISIHETKGTLIGSAAERLKPGLAGAILAELALQGKIRASQNHRLQVIDNSPVEVTLLDETLSALKKADKEHKLGYWINLLGQKSDKHRRQVVKGLLQKGLVTQEDDRLHWVIPSPLQPESKASPKHLLIERLRAAVLGSGDPQPREIVLLSLVRACGLLDLAFLRDERKLAGQAIYESFISQAINDPAIQAIQEIEAVIGDLVEDE